MAACGETLRTRRRKFRITRLNDFSGPEGRRQVLEAGRAGYLSKPVGLHGPTVAMPEHETAPRPIPVPRMRGRTFGSLSKPTANPLMPGTQWCNCI